MLLDPGMKKNKDQQRKKLKLEVATVRQLNESELRNVGGAAGDEVGFFSIVWCRTC